MQMPERETITFTREQFYEKVWSAPATRIAKELGCSDVLIGKVCKLYKIPKPYLGYWARLEHGKKPKKIQLLPEGSPDLQKITFYKYPASESTISEPEREVVYDPDIQHLLEKARSMAPITVTTLLTRPHTMVSATKKRRAALRRPYMERSAEEREPVPILSIDVSESSETRALCIFDALIKRVEQLGGTIGIKTDRWSQWRFHTVACFGGEEVSQLRIRERRKQVHVPADKKKHSWDRDVEMQSTGLLVIDKGPGYVDTVLLGDTKRKRVEDGLNDLVIEFIRLAGRMRIERRQAEVARQQREEEARIARQRQEELQKRRDDLAKRQKAEQARVDELVRHASGWEQSQQIRCYLASLCDMLLERHGAIGIESEAAEYLRWAHKQANRLDPLKPSPPSVLDEHI